MTWQTVISPQPLINCHLAGCQKCTVYGLNQNIYVENRPFIMWILSRPLGFSKTFISGNFSRPLGSFKDIHRWNLSRPLVSFKTIYQLTSFQGNWVHSRPFVNWPLSRPLLSFQDHLSCEFFQDHWIFSRTFFQFTSFKTIASCKVCFTTVQHGVKHTVNYKSTILK